MRRALTLALLAALAAACAGPTVAEKKTIAQLEREGDFAGAARRLLASKDDYGPANAVLYDLDVAQALADAGRRAEADPYFAGAERRMEGLWTLSVSKLAGDAVANENVDDYRGEDFEHALAFVMRALNYVAMGRRDDALVEAKRVELDLAQLEKEAPRRRTYRDDAFAHWLAAELYADLGQPDDARISGADAARAYRAYARDYGVSAPAGPVGAGPAEVVFVHLDGLAPRKVRRQGGGPLGLLLQTSYPAYETLPSEIASDEVTAAGVSTSAAVAEDVGAIAAKDLEERLLALKVRSNLRAAAKLAATVVGVQSADSEFADVRCWQTLPARVRVARLRVPEGRGELKVRYLDASGREVAARTFPYEARAGARAWVLDRTAF